MNNKNIIFIACGLLLTLGVCYLGYFGGNEVRETATLSPLAPSLEVPVNKGNPKVIFGVKIEKVFKEIKKLKRQEKEKEAKKVKPALVEKEEVTAEEAEMVDSDTEEVLSVVKIKIPKLLSSREKALKELGFSLQNTHSLRTTKKDSK